MSTRSALAGAATTAVLLAVLGNPGTVEAARDADNQALALTLTGFADWDLSGLPGDAVVAVVLRLGLGLALVTLLCAVAGRSQSRGAAFVAGWGALALAAAAAGAATYVYQVAVLLDGHTLSPTYLDGLVVAANSGGSFGIWTGWLVGLAVALVTQPAAATARAAPAATRPRPDVTAPGRRIAEPPPPWWAPTQGGAGNTAIRPGPTDFPPGGFGPAVAGMADVTAVQPSPAPDADSAPPEAPAAEPPAAERDAHDEATREMSTASGDPHPSDPDATAPVGIPPDPDATRVPGSDLTDQDDDTTAAADADRQAPPGEAGDAPATGEAAADDDTTAAPDADHTVPSPRQPD